MQSFKEKVVVVTGGASGIGRALANAFLEEGAKVVISDVEKTALDKTATELAAKGGVQENDLKMTYNCEILKNPESFFLMIIFLKVAHDGKSFDYPIKTYGRCREAEKTKKVALGSFKKHSSSNMGIYSDEVPEAAHV